MPPGVTVRVRARSGGWRLGCATCAAALRLVIAAEPAEAHLPGINAASTNYRTGIIAVSPPIPGLEVRVAEIGGELELINRTGQQVVVLGARLEPYLRVEADGGVDENRRSPTWLAGRPSQQPKAAVDQRGSGSTTRLAPAGRRGAGGLARPPGALDRP